MSNVPYIFIAVITLAILVVILLALWIVRGKRPGRPMSKLGLISLLLVIGGIVFGETRAVGYSLIGTGLVVAIVDIVLKSRKCGPSGLIEEQAEKKEENLNRIKELLKDKEEISNNDVENFLGVSNATAERYLDELEKQGILEQVGKTGRYTHYKRV